MKKYLSLSAIIIFAVYFFSIAPLVLASEASKTYKVADNQLNQVYQELISKIKVSRNRQSLVDAERSWIGSRDADINFYGKYYAGSKNGLFLKIKLTEDRITYLQLILRNLSKQDGDNLGPF
jgi:uncharacterized protein YecT (DUF1311 family)